jgi:hypothetical protein
MEFGMIRNITAGQGIYITNNGHSMPYIDMTRASAGMVRYNNNNFEIYDGSSWIIMQSSYPQVELSGDAQAVINWARTKMAEESRIKELAAKHPTVADAVKAVERAEEAVKIAVALCDVS